MGKAIAIFNQKGGVGKTTTNINLGACLAERKKKILLVDMDPQGNTTSGLGFNKSELEVSIYDLLMDASLDPNDVILQTCMPNMDLIPSNVNLAGAEVELVVAEEREVRFTRVLSQVKDKYDYIFIDCPPSLGMLTINTLTAVDAVLIPMQCEFYALEGVSQLMNTIEMVRNVFNPELDVQGVVISMFDGRTNLSNAVVDEINKYFTKKVYVTKIPKNVKLAEAPSFGVPIIIHDKSSKGSEAFRDLAKEFIKREKRENRPWLLRRM